MTHDLQAALDRLVASGVPGAVAYSPAGSRASGIGDRRTGAPARVGDRFRIGSNTKPFVAAVVLQLVAEGRLSLADPVTFAPTPGITVRHLLQHTSGLPEYSDDPRLLAPYVTDPGHHWEPGDLLALIKGQRHFAPGAKFAYANTNYILLGLVIEAITGHCAADEVHRRLIEPLRLTGTIFPVRGAAIPGRHLRGHLTGLPTSYGVPDGILDFTDLSPSIGWTAGGMLSTVADLARFHRALLTGRVLSPDLGRAMIADAEPHGYGLGLARIARPGIAGWGHDGRFPGYLSIVVTSDDGARQAVVALNTDRVLSCETEAATDEVLRVAFNVALNA